MSTLLGLYAPYRAHTVVFCCFLPALDQNISNARKSNMSSFSCIHDFLKLEVCDGVADLDLPLSLSACPDANVCAPSAESFISTGRRTFSCLYSPASYPRCPSCQPLSSGFHRPSMATPSTGAEYKRELPRYRTHWFLPCRAQTVAWLPPRSVCQTAVQCNTSSHRKLHYSSICSLYYEF